jgi:hypothetical protein
MDAVTLTVGKLGDQDAGIIASRLTRSGSEFQAEVLGRASSKPATPIAIVRNGSDVIAAWAATHSWRGMQTLEGFTAEHTRRKGLARLAAAMLVADGAIDPRKPVCVFSPHCVEIARSVGCRDVRLFERHGDDWIETP